MGSKPFKAMASMLGCAENTNNSSKEIAPESSQVMNRVEFNTTEEKLKATVNYLDFLHKEINIFNKFCDQRLLQRYLRSSYRYQLMALQRWNAYGLSKIEKTGAGPITPKIGSICLLEEFQVLARR